MNERAFATTTHGSFSRGPMTEKAAECGPTPHLTTDVTEIESLRLRIAELEAGREKAIAVILSGRFCRLADHMQGVCDCAEIAALLKPAEGT